MNHKIKAVLFDLDGTLVDTAPDMVATLNQLLSNHKQANITYIEGRNYVSQGAVALIKYGFKRELGEGEITSLRQEYLTLYAAISSQQSALFGNMNKVLEHIEQQGMPWGVVTNKPEDLAIDLLKKLGLYDRLAAFYGGDTLAQKKPHPAQLLAACEDIKTKPEHVIYLGDDERDIVAAKAANMPNAVMNYGYINAPVPPLNWHADYYFDDAIDIIDILKARQ